MQAFWIFCSRGLMLNCLLIFALPALFGVKMIWIPLLVAESVTLIFVMLLKKSKKANNLSVEQGEENLDSMSQDNWS